ncbi:MAG: hypothetical protein U0Q03_19890 [Acidimicrobiales bacterium]
MSLDHPSAARRQGARWGARSAVAAGFALLAAALAGSPLYVSSAGSEAVQLALASTCGADAGMRLPLLADPATGEPDVAAVAALTDSLPHTEPGVLERIVSLTYTLEPDDGLVRRLVLVDRTGWEAQLGVAPPDDSQVVVQQAMRDIVGVTAGDRLTLSEPGTGAAATSAEVTVAQVVPTIPVLPEPAFWCGLRDLLRPSAFGDPPDPMILGDAALLSRFAGTGSEWEVRPAEVRTLHDATVLRDRFEQVLDQHEAATEQAYVAAGIDPNSVFGLDLRGTEGMSTVVDRGEALSHTIGRAVAPVRLAGVVAAVAVLLAAATMFARERRRELRLYALRGVGPVRTARRLLAATALPALVGTVIGAGLAVLAVRRLGPTPELEAGALRSAGLACLCGVVLGLVLVAVTASVVGDRFVDRSTRSHWWRFVPWELPVVALAAWSYRRLDRGGGLRFTGVESRGGELLAQAFPLLALAAVVAVAARPVRWAISKLRRRGRSLPLAWRLGWRRATAEPALATVLVSAIVLAVGAVVLSGVLSASASAELRDKAAVFVGSDLAVTMAGPAVLPDDLAASATVVVRADGRVVADERTAALDDATLSTGVDLLGVDRATFAAIATTPRALGGLDELLAPLGSASGGGGGAGAAGGAGGAIPAVVVHGGALGDLADLPLSVRGSDVVVTPVATASEFPGLRSGTTLVVVDAAALRDAGVDVTDAVWLRDPPADAVDRLVAAGNRVRTVVSPADVFDVVSFRAQRWTYDVLAAFGVLVGVVVLVLQLLVVEARASTRRLSQVVLGRAGVGGRARWTAAVLESAVPLVSGGVLGALAARLVAGRAVPRLDPLPTLAPPGAVVVPGGTLAVAAGVVAVVVLLVAAVAALSDARGDTMEVVRGTA